MSIPLAQQLRPQTIDEVVGQRHLIGENMPVSYTHLRAHET